MGMKIVTVIGARPQFIKAAPLLNALGKLDRACEHVLVHTGQHYDEAMYRQFFSELSIPAPNHDLEVGSGSHGRQTAAMMERLEPILEDVQPDWVVVYGDTNSTIAGSLVAAKLHQRVAHVEAGLRSFNRTMPEELNRVVTDHLSNVLLCPSETAVRHLEAEGITNGVHMIGDVMADALAMGLDRIENEPGAFEELNLQPGGYLLATIHRASNTDDPDALVRLVTALSSLDEPVVFPVHPRTRARLNELGVEQGGNLIEMDPVGYLDMVRLEKDARMILTDSGGVQKEAYWQGVPCVTLREDTEWVETIENGWNTLVGTDVDAIRDAVRSFAPPAERPELYGDGHASERCVEVLIRGLRDES